MYVFVGTVILICILILISRFVDKSNNTPPAAAPLSNTKTKKRVRFSPDVKISPVGGRKSDRFNPDLNDSVKRNTLQAMQVGGARALAKLDLSRG